MVKPDSFRKMALALPQASEDAHFDKTAFKVAGKKIFATLNAAEQRVTLKLSPARQDVFCTFDPTVVFPVPNKWGKAGWTHFNLKTVRREMLADALRLAYCGVAPKKLADLLDPEPEI